MAKRSYVCQQCGSEFSQWIGRCMDCGEWNSLIEQAITTTKHNPRHTQKAYGQSLDEEVTTLERVEAKPYSRWHTDFQELDRVLGGGLVPGSIILVGGDPGIGKSTLLLQTLCQLSPNYPSLYITGEESLEQVALRARRLNLPEKHLKLQSATQVEKVIASANKIRPNILVIDSIQTLYSETIQSSPGSVSQLRETASQLVSFAKQTNTALFLVGHVTKEGALAGPRVLEHMVDAVVYFEGSNDSRYRMIRAVKNRFGAVNELGIFAMTDQGLREVKNPSAIFLSSFQNIAGSTVLVTWEGTRPLLLELQALLTDSQLANPRRVTVGVDQSRLAMLLAVLQRHAGIHMAQQDVFVNVVSGIRVQETAVDLALCLAMVSSLKDRSLMERTVVFGELGLAGEIRPVHSGVERITEAEKHGFEYAIVPQANTKALGNTQIKLLPVNHINEALDYVCT